MGFIIKLSLHQLSICFAYAYALRACDGIGSSRVKEQGNVSSVTIWRGSTIQLCFAEGL